MTGVVRSVAVRFSADVAQLVGAYRTVAAESDKLTAKQQSAIAGVGKAGAVVGVAAAAALGGAVFAAANFDEAMSSVQAATHESAAGMDQLRQAALEAGAETVFSASEAAAGIENLAKAGVSTADILGGGLSGALDLAAAGQIAVADAAEFTATALTQFQLAGSEATHVADLLAAGAGKAQGEVADMANALNYAGVPAANLGVSIEETAGTIALLAKNGIIGEQAGTGLRGMLSSLTSPSAAARKEMDSLGISLFDAQGEFIGLDGMAGQLQKTMSGLTQEERANSLGRIFGNAQLQTANVLYREGADGVRMWTAAVDDQGFAAETAAMKLDNLKGDLEALMGSLETAAIGTGSGSQAPLRDLVQNITAVVNAYNKLPDAVQGGVASLLGVAALTGGGLFVGSKAILGIAAMRENLAALDGAAGKAAGSLKTLGVVAGSALVLDAVIGALATLNREIDRAAPNVAALQRSLRDLASGGSVQPVVDDLGDFHGAIEALNDPSMFQSLLGGITDFYNKIPVVGSVLPNMLEIAPVTGDQLRQMREAEASLASLDQALVGLAQSEGPKAAKRAFDQLASTYRLTAADQERLLSLLPGAAEAFGTLGGGAKNAGRGLDSMLDPLTVIEEQLAQTTGAAQQFQTALEDLNGLLDKRAALRNYEAALDDFRKGFKPGAGFNLDIGGGRENLAKLDAIASAAGTVASHLGKVARTEFIGNVVSQLRTMAKNMDLPRDQVNALIRELKNLDGSNASPNIKTDGVPKTRGDITDVERLLLGLGNTTASPNVRVETGPAYSAIQNIRSWLWSIPDEQVYVRVNRIGGTTSSYGGQSTADPDRRAGGGPVYPGRTYWVGEEGPELAVFSEPAQIIPHRESMRIAAAPAPALTGRAMASAGGYGGRVGGGVLEISGTLDTPFGPAQVHGIARETARAVINDHDDWKRKLDDRD